MTDVLWFCTENTGNNERIGDKNQVICFSPLVLYIATPLTASYAETDIRVRASSLKSFASIGADRESKISCNNRETNPTLELLSLHKMSLLILTSLLIVAQSPSVQLEEVSTLIPTGNFKFTFICLLLKEVRFSFPSFGEYFYPVKKRFCCYNRAIRYSFQYFGKNNTNTDERMNIWVS